jgi:hypothetical protein
MALFNNAAIDAACRMPNMFEPEYTTVFNEDTNEDEPVC